MATDAGRPRSLFSVDFDPARQYGHLLDQVVVMKRWLLILTCAFAATVLSLIVLFPALNRHAEAVACSNQMHAVLFAATLSWPSDHNGRLPFDFLSMSNELGTPKLLLCPSDHGHLAASSWASFTTNNSSYELVAPGLLKSNATGIFMRCPIHGYVGYSDDRLLDASGRLVKPDRLW